ncbi:VWA domain-containing protein [Halobacteriovorax sp.]|uniref:vWA domain-containing protein n=1 Tax=Halobacteriovorax sp. TaxID=2020862 RepID=UPI00356761C9
MSFEYHEYLVILAPLLVLYFLLFRKNDKKFFQWVEDHWFLKRTTSNKISRLLFFIFIVLLVLSTLDLRGPEEKIETSIPDQKTVILIDKSASMLVEDVRPNRFKKAVMMARHFVKKAAGHQISIIVFSDTHKRVVPFTDDIDLLDSILGGLLGLDINVGGSQLSLAMTEATSYFSLGDEYNGGNLLVFTDGEEHDTLENFELNEDVNLAIVGVGTLNGGPIPLRRTGGSFQGYKKFNGKEINSRLNEKNIKDFVNRTKNSKYWISLSYSLPTDEILDFFRLKFQSKLSKGQTRVRPVLVKYLIIPAVLVYFISFLFSLRRSYVALGLLLMFFNYSSQVAAQDEESEPSPQDIQAALLLNKMKDGSMDKTSKLKIAEQLLKLNKTKESSTIYQETIKSINDYPNETLLNMGTSLLKSGQIPEALELFEKMRMENRLSEKDKKIVENNTLKAILNKNQQNKKNKKNEEKEKKKEGKDDKKDDKNKNEDNENNEDKENKKKNKKSKDGQEGKDNKEKNKKPSDGNEEDDKEKDKNKDKNDKGDEKKENKKNNKSVKDKEDEIKKKRKMVKIPATLKQLMNDDRGLQKRFLKTTVGKDKRSEKRDW